ncbi:MAG: hypothetical protein QXJ59_04320 [Thermofilaceae archaeon]
MTEKTAKSCIERERVSSKKPALFKCSSLILSLARLPWICSRRVSGRAERANAIALSL